MFNLNHDTQPEPSSYTRGELEKRGIRILVCFPIERCLYGEGWLMSSPILRKGWAGLDYPYAPAYQARNRFLLGLRDVTSGRSGEHFTHLVMLDIDHFHRADVVERLARWVVDHPEREVVCGLNFLRAEPYRPLVTQHDQDGSYHRWLSWNEPLEKIVERTIVAPCSILVARSLVEKIPPPWFWYPVPDVEQGRYDTEDVPWGDMLGDKGIPIYLDTTTVSPHMRINGVDESDWLQYIVDHPSEFAGSNLRGRLAGKKLAKMAGKKLALLRAERAQ